jgi:hypothetical protein
MRYLWRPILTVTFVALFAASIGIPFAAHAANRYDGTWSVTIFTRAGDCPQSLRYSVRVAAGRVLSDDQSYQVSGSVAANGATRVIVSEKGRSASGSGRLSGNQGAGIWRTGSGECSGQWTAERRG